MCSRISWIKTKLNISTNRVSHLPSSPTNLPIWNGIFFRFRIFTFGNAESAPSRCDGGRFAVKIMGQNYALSLPCPRGMCKLLRHVPLIMPGGGTNYSLPMGAEWGTARDAFDIFWSNIECSEQQKVAF